MATYFDPKSWSPLRAVDIGKRLLDPGWLDQWSTFTTAWLDPVADLGAGTVTALMPDMLMTLLSEGILSQFGGQEVSATLLGHEMKATLRTLKARRRGAHFQTKTVLTELLWNGHPIEEMTVIAHGVRLVPGVPTKVRATNLDITGTVTTAALVGWLNDWHLDWELGVDSESGLITARHRRRKIRAVVDAAIGENLLSIAMHRASWLGVRVPRRWVRVAPVPLTELPKNLRIVRADREGDRVRFRIDIPEITGSFDLAQIRSAIVAGTTLIIF
ncbi:hypothetical protein [Nocardia mexicana]|uniref:Uncharacterized protein n=1 Tax=Nocardia mexicana TaxID=279262 RepID=A0A370GXT7_9NOCA|nr:hypothetical protein [Nocardia mexicana]RDI48299.1 hypothetical protein DFR68_108128 [Nocardia mexicana]